MSRVPWFTFRLFAPVTTLDLLTLALLIQIAGIEGELNPIIAGLYASGGIAGVLLWKAAGIATAAAFESLAYDEGLGAVGRRVILLATIVLSTGLAANIASLMAIGLLRTAGGV